MSLAMMGPIAGLFLVLLAIYRWAMRPAWLAPLFIGGPLLMIVNAGRLDLQALTWAKVLTLAVSVGLVMAMPRATGAKQRALAWSVWAILMLNILEAVVADAVHGRWVNAVVGGALMLTAAGPSAIVATRRYGRPALDYDLPWSWIAAYSFWNFTVVCGNYPLHWCEHFAVLSAPVVSALLVGDRRAWLEARALTLSAFAVSIVLIIDVAGWPWIPDSPSPGPWYPWLSGIAVVAVAVAVVGRVRRHRTEAPRAMA